MNESYRSAETSFFAKLKIKPQESKASCAMRTNAMRDDRSSVSPSRKQRMAEFAVVLLDLVMNKSLKNTGSKKAATASRCN
jgi:hypothetical protein